jgi:hypothetical protein
MHTRYADLARVTTAACWRDDAPAQDDALAPARGIVFAVLGSVVFWLLVWAALT